MPGLMPPPITCDEAAEVDVAFDHGVAVDGEVAVFLDAGAEGDGGDQDARREGDGDGAADGIIAGVDADALDDGGGIPAAAGGGNDVAGVTDVAGEDGVGGGELPGAVFDFIECALDAGFGGEVDLIALGLEA